jgi:hypothetical protein
VFQCNFRIYFIPFWAFSFTYQIYVLWCLFKRSFVESKTAWQRGIFAQNTSRSVDFCIKSDSNALAEFSKPRIRSEQVISKLYSNFKSFNLIFPLPKVQWNMKIFSKIWLPEFSDSGKICRSSGAQLYVLGWPIADRRATIASTCHTLGNIRRWAIAMLSNVTVFQTNHIIGSPAKLRCKNA